MHEDKPQQSEKSGAINKTLEFSAYPLAGVAGTYALHSAVSNTLYDTLKKQGKLDKLSDNINNFIAETGGSNQAKTAEKLSELHKINTRDYKNRLKELGFKNFKQQYDGLHSNQKLNSVVSAFTAAGITLGVILTIAKNTSLMEKLDKPKNAKAPDSSPSR
jgi:hypothetical protein